MRVENRDGLGDGLFLARSEREIFGWRIGGLSFGLPCPDLVPQGRARGGGPAVLNGGLDDDFTAGDSRSYLNALDERVLTENEGHTIVDPRGPFDLLKV